MKSDSGYQPAFLGAKMKVSLPKISAGKKIDLAPVKGNKDALLHYPHHSVALSKTRKLPLFAAVNIDGQRFRVLKRTALFDSGSDEWTIDQRASDFQWGHELYSASASDFDKGHMVKREDPQWGDDDAAASNAARSTFFYSNCAPQVGDLNRKEWRGLEDFILKKKSVPDRLRINVFTGPVLADDDPVFVTNIKGQRVQIPALFWKLVYFTADGKTLSRVAFLMGQKKLLLKRGIAKPKEEELEGVILKPTIFDDYEDAAMYQVNVSVVEKLTGLGFSPARDPYRDDRPVKLILQEVEIGGDLESFPANDGPAFDLEGIVLE